MGTFHLAPRQIHILCFPFPAKGHMNPMLHFANRLVSKDFMVTFITTASTMKSLKAKATGFMNIVPIAAGLEENPPTDVNSYFQNFRIAASESLSELIQKLKKCDFPPRMLVYDSIMPWVLDIAHGLGLRGASFFTQSCSVCAIYYHMLQGTIEKPLKEPTVSVPSLPTLESYDLPYFDFIPDVETVRIVTELLLNQFSNIQKVDYILFNSFNKLEDEVANWMGSQWPIKTIGPIAPSLTVDKELKNQEEDRNYLFETNTEACMKWLDERETGSVVYVSMGSVASPSEEEMEELAQGIVRSNCYFLWVVRAEEESKLPKTFKPETPEKGLIINWCPQLDVLAHRAVACFVTHCGWNSTIEALISGVPMIAVPQFVDQTTNAKFIADVWKVGVRGKADAREMVKREEIEHCIRKVTQTEEWLEIKRNALKWKELAKEAVEDGGSSDRNIEEFVSTLIQY